MDKFQELTERLIDLTDKDKLKWLVSRTIAPGNYFARVNDWSLEIYRGRVGSSNEYELQLRNDYYASKEWDVPREGDEDLWTTVTSGRIANLYKSVESQVDRTKRNKKDAKKQPEKSRSENPLEDLANSLSKL